MKSIRRKNLDELAKVMPVLSEKEQREFVGGDKVVITIVRTGYGNNSTFGHFVATAYDDNGQFISSISGATLERQTDVNVESIPDSGVAIAPGSYDIISGTYNDKSGYFQVANVEGRTGIFFHEGNFYNNSTGCILLGNSGIYDPATGDYTISNSSITVSEFNEFLRRHGDEGVILNLS